MILAAKILKILRKFQNIPSATSDIRKILNTVKPRFWNNPQFWNTFAEDQNFT